MHVFIASEGIWGPPQDVLEKIAVATASSIEYYSQTKFNISPDNN